MLLQVRADSPLSGDLLSVCEAISAGSPPPPPGPLASICESYLRQQRRSPAPDLPPPPTQLTQHQLMQRECLMPPAQHHRRGHMARTRCPNSR